MKNEEIINKNLNIVFSTLRQKEEIEEGEVSKLISPVDIYSILMNRRYKIEHDVELNDIEENIAKESGNNIRMYIAYEYYELGINKLDKIPFPSYDISSEMLFNEPKTYQHLNYKNNGK